MKRTESREQIRMLLHLGSDEIIDIGNLRGLGRDGMNEVVNNTRLLSVFDEAVSPAVKIDLNMVELTDTCDCALGYVCRIYMTV